MSGIIRVRREYLLIYEREISLCEMKFGDSSAKNFRGVQFKLLKKAMGVLGVFKFKKFVPQEKCW